MDATLNGLGWEWRENGALIYAIVDGRPIALFVPLHHIQIEFGKSMNAVGCPLVSAIGDPPTVAGLFGSIKRAVRRASRAVKRAVPKSIRRAAVKITRRAKSYGRNIARRARQIATNPKQLAMFAANPAFALNSNKLARDVRTLAQHSGIPVVQQGARAAEALTSWQERLTGVHPASVYHGVHQTLRDLQAGQRAEEMLRRGIRRPSTLKAINRARQQHAALQQIAQAAQRGIPQAQHWMGALSSFAGGW